jgi:hypothetical protein
MILQMFESEMFPKAHVFVAWLPVDVLFPKVIGF